MKKPVIIPVTDVLLQQYITNKMRRSIGDASAPCSKCKHLITDGEAYYRDVMTGKAAHITCRARKATQKAVA